MFENVKSADAAHRESALRIFSCLARYLATLQQHFATFSHLIKGCMEDAAVHVKVAAMRALGSLVICIEQRSQRKPFTQLMVVLLQAISDMLRLGAVDDTVEALEILVEIAETHPRFFSSHVGNVVEAMLVMSRTTQFDDNVRQLAVEVLLTIAEKAASMCRKMPGNSFVKNLLPVCFQMMLELEEDNAEWENSDESDDDMGNYAIGFEAVDRLARSIGPKKTLPVAFEMISQFLSQQGDWKYRHAGLMILSQVKTMRAKSTST